MTRTDAQKSYGSSRSRTDLKIVFRADLSSDLYGST